MMDKAMNESCSKLLEEYTKMKMVMRRGKCMFFEEPSNNKDS